MIKKRDAAEDMPTQTESWALLDMVIANMQNLLGIICQEGLTFSSKDVRTRELREQGLKLLKEAQMFRKSSSLQ